MDRPCRIEMFGGLRIRQGDRVVARFSTYKTGALLAYLAYHPRLHSRESVIDLLWPDSPPSAGRASLNMALSSLRKQLEPPGVPRGAVLQTFRSSVQLNPAGVRTDAAEFDEILNAASSLPDGPEYAKSLVEVLDSFEGGLLPGYYEDWIVTEQERLAEQWLQASLRLIACLEKLGNYEHAVERARRAVAREPLREEAHCALIRAHCVAGQTTRARAQIKEMERIFYDELGEGPSSHAREIIEQSLAHTSNLKDRPFRRAESTVQNHPTTPTVDPPSVNAVASGTKPFTSNLPLRFTRFFGREKELSKLLSHLSPDVGVYGRRLVTITGPSGTGKTRLAVETGARLSDSYNGAVWFVPLDDLFDARHIPAAIADTMHLSHGAKVDPLDPVVEFLNGTSPPNQPTSTVCAASPKLLILDNFEHIALEGARFVVALMDRVPNLNLLVTSHRRLALPGEQLMSLSPLSVPSGHADTVEGEDYFQTTTGVRGRRCTPAELIQYPAVQLFIDRAQATMPDFQVTPRNCDAVGRICAKLEGVPLALELAATRVQSLSLEQMVERLSDRFEILANRRMDKRSRHRSLWAAIDWSSNLLPPETRVLFGRLGVFRGGCDVNTAEDICQDRRALDHLTHLREQSLVRAEDRGGTMRFRMLESVREFATENLAGDEARDLELRHRDYFLKKAEESEAKLYGLEQSAWVQWLDANHDNMRVAMRRCLDNKDRESAGRFAGALERFWWVQGRAAEGGEWLEAVLDCDGRLETPIRAKVLLCAGSMAWARNDFEKAEAFHLEALELNREMNDELGMARALGSLGNVARQRNQEGAARRYYEESLGPFRAADDVFGVATSLLNLGTLAEGRLDDEEAFALYDESLKLYRQLGDRHSISIALSNLGNIACNLEKTTLAASLLHESLAIRRELGDRKSAVSMLAEFGKLALSLRQPERAAQLLSACESLHDRMGLSMAPIYRTEFSAAMEKVRCGLDKGSYSSACREGREMTFDEAVQLASETG